MRKSLKQRGYSLIEMVGLLGIAAIATGLGAMALNSGTQVTEQAAVAREFKAIQAAADRYVRENYNDLVESGNQVLDITGGDIDAYLPPGVRIRNTYNQAYALAVWQDPGASATQLSYMVYTTGGDGLEPADAGRTAGMLGANAGFVPQDGFQPRIGSLTRDDDPIPAGLVPAGDLDAGHLAAMASFDPQMEEDTALYRQRIPGRPELNRMQTDLALGGFSPDAARFGVGNVDIADAEQVQARGSLAADRVFASSWINVVAPNTGAFQRPDSHIVDEGDCAGYDPDRVNPCDPGSRRTRPFALTPAESGVITIRQYRPLDSGNSQGLTDAIYFSDSITGEIDLTAEQRTDALAMIRDSAAQRRDDCRAGDPNALQGCLQGVESWVAGQVDSVLGAERSIIDELGLAELRQPGQARTETGNRLDVDLLELVDSLHRCGGPDGLARDAMTLRRVTRFQEDPVTGQRVEVDAIVLECIEEIAVGAVAHFDQNSCPARWYPLIDAQGRFLRGIDPNAAPGGNVPALVRTQGGNQRVTLQDNQLPGVMRRIGGPMSAARGHSGCRTCHTQTGSRAPIDVMPAYVSLLHCVKGVPNESTGGALVGGPGGAPVFENQGVATVPVPEPLGKPLIGQDYAEVINAYDPEGGPLTYELAGGALPPGLTLSGNIIQGTPAAAVAGSEYTFRIRATDIGGLSSTREFLISFSANEGPEWQVGSQLPPALTGQPYFPPNLRAIDPDPLVDDCPNAANVRNGEGAIMYEVISTNLPSGITLSAVEGEYPNCSGSTVPAPVLSGTTNQQGEFSVTIRATDPVGDTNTRQFFFSVGLPAFWADEPSGTVFLPDGVGTPPLPNCLAEPLVGDLCASSAVPDIRCIDQSNPGAEQRVSNGALWPARRKFCEPVQQVAGQ